MLLSIDILDTFLVSHLGLSLDHMVWVRHRENQEKDEVIAGGTDHAAEIESHVCGRKTPTVAAEKRTP